jgi:hypothetical protein
MISQPEIAVMSSRCMSPTHGPSACMNSSDSDAPAPSKASTRRLRLDGKAPSQSSTYDCGWTTSTIHGTPNLSVHMPNRSPHICFSKGMVTVPPSESLSQ